MYLFVALLGLCCCVQAFSRRGEQGLLLLAVCGLLIVVASLVVEHRLWVSGPHWLCHVGSLVVVHGLSCSPAREILPDQGLNPCPLHWQSDSCSLCH